MTTPNRPTEPRIEPLDGADIESDDAVQELLASASVDHTPATNIFTTLVRHPGLFRKWLPFAGKLLAGKLAHRDRELLILRTGWRCQSEYEWGQHALLSAQLGITAEEIQRVQDGPDAPGWGPFDATLLRAADELHDDSCISDGTWAALAERYDEHQLTEVPMLVGQYHLVAFTLNSLGVQREDAVPGYDG